MPRCSLSHGLLEDAGKTVLTSSGHFLTFVVGKSLLRRLDTAHRPT